jgi:hypothetical protein
MLDRSLPMRFGDPRTGLQQMAQAFAPQAAMGQHQDRTQLAPTGTCVPNRKQPTPENDHSPISRADLGGLQNQERFSALPAIGGHGI